MKQSVNVICHHEYGDPAQVVKVERWPIEEIKPNEVLVLMKSAPISPADLNMLEGTYAVLPPLPAVVGNEGVGVVAQKGIAVSELRVGQEVISPFRTGSWCEAYSAPARELVGLPPGIEHEQAALCSSIIPTAWRMLEDFVSLNRGDWVVQNAANSSVGRSVVQVAKHRFLKTLNLVRRAELKDELLALGADAVLTEEEATPERVRELTGDSGVRLGLNGVSGRHTHALARLVCDHGIMVTYGAMSREPLSIGNGQLIFRDIQLRGFWINEWYRRVSEKEISRMFAKLLPLVREGKVKVPVEATYPLEEAATAVAHAARESRSGKIFFEMN